MALPTLLRLLLAVAGELTGQAEQMAEHIFTHQGAEDATHIGELIIVAAVVAQQYIHPCVARLQPAQLVRSCQQGFGACRLGEQNMSLADEGLGFTWVVGSQDAKMRQMRGLQQTLVVGIVLTEQ